MDIQGFSDMGDWAESFASCDYIYVETSGDYLAT